ncbi:MAG: cold-shock protein [Rubrobacteridae bacterium]|nr:cold-shock protein [Rubrobacteridae bacterium]
MAQGKVKWFDNKKGFGFIEQNEGADLFVHFSELKDEGFKALYEGDVVEYTVATNAKGETATDVKVITRNTSAQTDTDSRPNNRPPRTQSRKGPSEGVFNRSIEEQLKALRKSSKENLQDLANRQKRR